MDFRLVQESQVLFLFPSWGVWPIPGCHINLHLRNALCHCLQQQDRKQCSQAHLHIPVPVFTLAFSLLQHTEQYFCVSAFQYVNSNKATGLDNIAQVLMTCAEQLAFIFCIIFIACFSTNTVPATWKTACIVPIPKRPVISSLNDLRPIALNSAMMKVCEQVVLCKLEFSQRLHWPVTICLLDK